MTSWITRLGGIAIVVTLAALAALPAPAVAGDCGAGYHRCLAESVETGSPYQLHEMGCYSAYWYCVSRLLLLY